MSEMKKIMTCRDSSVVFHTDGKITISNSLLEDGIVNTYSKELAKNCLLQIISMGDQIPFGVMAEI